MKRVAVPKSRIRELLDRLIMSYRVAAPVKEGGVVEFREISSAALADLSDEPAYKSPKEFLFPRSEKILRFDGEGAHEECRPRKTAIFGVRPCDLEALRILSAIFGSGSHADAVFMGHLEHTTLIGLGCLKKKPGCFCDERNVDMGSSSECDVFLKDMGEYYEADVLTEKGEAVIEGFEGAGEIAEAAPGERTGAGEMPCGGCRAGGAEPALMRNDEHLAGSILVNLAVDCKQCNAGMTDEGHNAGGMKNEEDCGRKMSGDANHEIVAGNGDPWPSNGGMPDAERRADAERTTNAERGTDAESKADAAEAVEYKLMRPDFNEKELFSNPAWDKVSETCLGCGICTYVCPTCHCFAFRDVATKDAAERYRRWDSCMYPKFTLHASGHNPRPTKKERYRQRIMHKYVYIRQNYGLTACTGCGRCARSCPSGINIRTVAKTVLMGE